MGAIQYRMTQNAQLSANAETRQISGYGIVFDSDSHPLTIHDDQHGSVRVVEQISKRSIEGADISDVISAFNHNFEKVLGRTTSNTMKLTIDNTGVKYRVDAGNQTYANDLIESLQRGDISGSSFVFTYDYSAGYELTDRADGTIVAIPKRITKIYEMGPVTTPAYPETTAENRSGELEKAVKRHLETRQEKEGGPDDEEEESKPDEMSARAMDIMDMYELVSAAFYKEFDFKSDDDGDYDYYYIQSITLDNTMVVKSGHSKKLWQLGFTLGVDNSVSFTEKSTWTEVQKEYVPVREFFALKEATKRQQDAEHELFGSVAGPFIPKRYYELKARAKRRV